MRILLVSSGDGADSEDGVIGGGDSDSGGVGNGGVFALVMAKEVNGVVSVNDSGGSCYCAEGCFRGRQAARSDLATRVVSV